MGKYGISIRSYTVISAAELDEKVQEIVTLFPNCGEKTVSGRLKASGVVVQRQTVRVG